LFELGTDLVEVGFKTGRHSDCFMKVGEVDVVVSRESNCEKNLPTIVSPVTPLSFTA
jgi:hypothetical protein